MEITAFQVYGDNLGECQKFCELLIRFGQEFGLIFEKIVGPIDRPVYLFTWKDSVIGLLPCGRFNDWERNRRPYIGYEDSDIILCHVSSPQKVGKPILGIEFNDAIEAGNNAWQRFPRIVQAAEKGVPFIYSIPICDAEVKDGEIKSFRHPNVMIQIGQLILMAKHRTISITVYNDSPWYDEALAREVVTSEVSRNEGEKIIAGIASALIIASVKRHLNFSPLIIHEEARDMLKESFTRAMENMLHQISHFLSSDFTILKENPLFNGRDNFSYIIDTWWKHITDKKEISQKDKFYEWKIDTFAKFSIPFKKATSTRSVFKEKIKTEISKLNPLSYKRGQNEVALILDPPRFAKVLENAYSSLENEVINYIANQERPVLFLPIAGYVQDTGGPSFSRPDKGLVALIRTIFGDEHIFPCRTVLLYSQLVPSNWKHQIQEAEKEMVTSKPGQTNNLWREIVRFATVVIVDVYGSGMII